MRPQDRTQFAALLCPALTGARCLWAKNSASVAVGTLALSPEIAAGAVAVAGESRLRAVLAWGMNPVDLDLHVQSAGCTGGTNQLVFSGAPSGCDAGHEVTLIILSLRVHCPG